jgi:hypothetical protein
VETKQEGEREIMTDNEFYSEIKKNWICEYHLG